MKLDFIALDKLSVSRTNMRYAKKAPDVSDILPTVRSRGVLQTLLVRPNGAPDAFEIVAGSRRFHAAQIVAEERGEAEPLPCAILDDGDDAAAIEASLIENMARLDADEVTRWATFTRLVREGRTIDEIGTTFGLPDLTIKRVLALGNLLPRIRSLYAAEKIDRGTVRHLTLASKSQQKAWLALLDVPDARAPVGHQLKAWLFGGTSIAVSRALFDVAAYLPWAALVAEGVVLNKDGSFQRTARFRGPDLDSATPAELVATTGRLNNALRRLGSGWALFVEAQRFTAQHYPDDVFPDAASALVEREGAAQFAEEGVHFESAYFFTLLWMPPVEDAARAEGWLYEGRAESGSHARDALVGFVDRSDRLLHLVEGFVPEIAWLSDDETLSYLHSCVSTKRQRVRTPETPMHLSGFYYDYKNLQVTAAQPAPAPVGSLTLNAARAHIEGREVEAIVTPDRYDRFDFSAAFLSAHYAEYDPTRTTDWSGKKLDNAPSTVTVVGYTRTQPLASGAKLAAHVDSRFSSAYDVSDFDIPVQFEQRAFTKTNLTLTYSAPGDRWYIQAFAKNLENEISFSGYQSGRMFVAEPRTFGARGGVKF